MAMRFGINLEKWRPDDPDSEERLVSPENFLSVQMKNGNHPR
jgi:hypothetical protein